MVDYLLDLPWPFPCPVCGPVAPFYGKVCEACADEPRILPKACRAAIVQHLTVQMKLELHELETWRTRGAELERAYQAQPPDSLRDLFIHEACVREASLREYLVRQQVVNLSQTTVRTVWVFRLDEYAPSPNGPRFVNRRLAVQLLDSLYTRLGNC